MEKMELEPGMYQAVLLGVEFYTDNKEVADFLNENEKLPVEAFDMRFPGLVDAAITARKELDMERYAALTLLHRRGWIQASAGPRYMCIASNRIPVQ